MNIHTLTFDEASQNLHQSYHPTLRRIFESFLQPHESVLKAAECSRPDRQEDNVGNITFLNSSHSCFVIVTNYRWFRAGMSVWAGPAINEYITYWKSGSRLASWLGDGPFVTHGWATPPSRLPSEKELGKKSLTEFTGEYIHEVRLEALTDISSKREYVTQYNGEELRFVELLFGIEWITFKSNDGESIYALIQLAKSHNGEIPLEQASSTPMDLIKGDLVRELEKLGDMKEHGLLSDDEFLAAKRKLLDLA